MKKSKIGLIVLSAILLLALALFGLTSCVPSNGTNTTKPDPDNGVRDPEPDVPQAGLFKAGSDELVYSWEQLISRELVTVTDTTVVKFNDKLKGDVRIPDEITKIKSSAFKSCSGLTGVYIGPNVAEIGDSAFLECTGLKTLTIEGGVTKIGSKAFSGCTGLSSVVIGDGVTSIESSAFAGCTNLKYLVVSDSVTSIGNSAFSGCTGIKLAYIGKSVTSIGESAFKNCTALEKIFIPAKVSYIGSSAFFNCNVLDTVNYEGTLFQFRKVTIGKSNTSLTDTRIKYLMSAEDELTFILSEINPPETPTPEDNVATE